MTVKKDVQEKVREEMNRLNEEDITTTELLNEWNKPVYDAKGKPIMYDEEGNRTNKMIEWSKKQKEKTKDIKVSEKKISKMGKFLTLGISVPILLALFLGIPGLIIGVIISIITIVNIFK